MTDPFNERALHAAINVLRDSVESARMPSGEALASAAADLHAQAADHFARQLRAPARARVAPDRSGEGRVVRVSCDLTDGEAWNLAQFFKRAGFSDFRSLAQNEAEAYAMRDAADRVRSALDDAGYSPR